MSSSSRSGTSHITSKEPPPQSPEEIQTRSLVVFSFWAVALFLGLPIWWKTTAIYRASLPIQTMMDFADGKVCRPTFPLRVAVETPSLPASEAHLLLKTTQHAVDDLNDFSAHNLRLLTSAPNASLFQESDLDSESRQLKDDIALQIRLVPQQNGATPRSELHTDSPNLDVFYSPNQIPSSSSTSSPLATFIAKELQSIFSEEQATLSHLISSTASWSNAQAKALAPDVIDRLTRRSTRSFKYAPTYHLAFSLFTPSAIPADWNIETALREHIEPLLSSFSSISNFTVDTQVQLYAAFSPSISPPEYDHSIKAWTLSKEDLGGFINAAEWPLTQSIGAGPTINFIVYVPAPNHTPLLVRENGANAWLIPQWGGVRILNPSGSEVPKMLSGVDLEPVMSTFSAQLLALLGLPLTPRSLPLRLNTLTRVHAASLIFSASSTLGALARLTKTLPSISIPNTVATSVAQTISRLNAACADMRDGKFNSALQNARVAEAEAERAFFERSMVGQVYFPDEHKVAVYLPLLGTIAVPLVTSAVKELRRSREKKRAKAE